MPVFLSLTHTRGARVCVFARFEHKVKVSRAGFIQFCEGKQKALAFVDVVVVGFACTRSTGTEKKTLEDFLCPRSSLRFCFSKTLAWPLSIRTKKRGKKPNHTLTHSRTMYFCHHPQSFSTVCDGSNFSLQFAVSYCNLSPRGSGGGKFSNREKSGFHSTLFIPRYATKDTKLKSKYSGFRFDRSRRSRPIGLKDQISDKIHFWPFFSGFSRIKGPFWPVWSSWEEATVLFCCLLWMYNRRTCHVVMLENIERKRSFEMVDRGYWTLRVKRPVTSFHTFITIDGGNVRE